MRDYELVLILVPTLELERVEKVLGSIEELIKKNKGKVEKVDKWGKKKLAYPISRHRDGYYTIISFKGETKVIKELDRVAKINEDVMRHMVTQKES